MKKAVGAHSEPLVYVAVVEHHLRAHEMWQGRMPVYRDSSELQAEVNIQGHCLGQGDVVGGISYEQGNLPYVTNTIKGWGE